MTFSKEFCIFLLSLLINFLIIGGNVTKIREREDELPHNWAKYVAAIGIIHGDIFQHYCTGGIINPIAVLTVGQCITRIPKAKQLKALHVVAGSAVIFSNLNDTKPLSQIIKVKNVRLHEKFRVIFVKGSNTTYWRTSNNVALLQLRFALNIDKMFVDTLELPITNVKSTVMCTTLGWPHLYQKGPHTDRIYFHNLNILDDGKCEDFYYHHGYDKLCVKYYENVEEGAHYFDLGAPLICQGQLTGLAGFDYGHRNFTREGNIFLNMLNYTDWIKSNIPYVIKYVRADIDEENCSFQNQQIIYIFITTLIVLTFYI